MYHVSASANLSYTRGLKENLKCNPYLQALYYDSNWSRLSNLALLFFNFLFNFYLWVCLSLIMERATFGSVLPYFNTFSFYSIVVLCDVPISAPNISESIYSDWIVSYSQWRLVVWTKMCNEGNTLLICFNGLQSYLVYTYFQWTNGSDTKRLVTMTVLWSPLIMVTNHHNIKVFIHSVNSFKSTNYNDIY